MKTLAFTFALVVIACGSEEFEVPPPYHGTLPDNPRSCGEVRAYGSASQAHVVIDNQPVDCAGKDVVCDVSDLPAFDGVCLTGLTIAVCEAESWVLRCDLDSGVATPVDGGDGG